MWQHLASLLPAPTSGPVTNIYSGDTLYSIQLQFELQYNLIPYVFHSKGKNMGLAGLSTSQKPVTSMKTSKWSGLSSHPCFLLTGSNGIEQVGWGGWPMSYFSWALLGNTGQLTLLCLPIAMPWAVSISQTCNSADRKHRRCVPVLM